MSGSPFLISRRDALLVDFYLWVTLLVALWQTYANWYGGQVLRG